MEKPFIKVELFEDDMLYEQGFLEWKKSFNVGQTNVESEPLS